ncbi:MAG: hypothetical protein MRY21_07385 [Simkaniaceae bacterium]|nr:hypothetical protein [Simkaniaceae bacterium]
MKKTLLLAKVLVCLASFGFMLYGYLEATNALTIKRMQLPELAKQLAAIQENNARLQFEVDSFENPSHLLELLAKKEYSHLKHPVVDQVLLINQSVCLKKEPSAGNGQNELSSSTRHTLVLGAK